MIGTILGMRIESHLGWMLEHSLYPYMDPLMVLMMSSFMGYFMETHWDALTVKFMALMKASNWDVLTVNRLALYLEM